MSIALCSALHVGAMAGTGRLARITIRECVFGFGPTLLIVGPIRLRLIPLGGSVQFKDSRVEDLSVEGRAGAFDSKPLLIRLLVILSGCVALLLLAGSILGKQAIPAFLVAFGQVVQGAAGPLSTAQEFLVESLSFSSSSSAVLVLGFVASKMAAANLLPLPAMNLGSAIGTLADSAGVSQYWPRRLTVVLLWVNIALLAAWAVALGYFVAASNPSSERTAKSQLRWHSSAARVER